MPRRAEILAAAAVAGLAAGLLLAPLALALAVTFDVFGRLTRFRPHWLLAPAAAGAAVTAAAPGPALAALWAVPRRAAALLAGGLAHPATLSRLAAVAALAGRAAPRQLPSALPLAAAAAAIAWWARRLHTSERDRPPYRAGLVVRWRRWRTTARARAGRVVTGDGVVLGTDLATGRAAAATWQEAAGGVLVTGADPAAVAATGFQFTRAAITLRTPVVVVDLAGIPWLPGALAGLCAAAGAPLLRCDAHTAAWYEPLRDAAPDRAAALVMGVAGWDGVPEQARLACRDCLATAFALLAALPSGPEDAGPDGLAGLLRPGALRAAAAGVPSWHPAGPALARRAEAAERWLAHEPAAPRLLTRQLAALRASEPGRLLPPGPRIDLGEVIRGRAAALFSLGHSAAAGATASLVALDLATRYADLHRQGIAPDGLVWFSGCEAVGPAALAALTGARTGLAPVLGTTSAPAAARLAGTVGVCVAHRVADQRLAGQIAAMTGPGHARAGRARPGHGRAAGATGLPFGTSGAFAVPAGSLCSLPADEFVLIAGARVVASGRAARPAGPG